MDKTNFSKTNYEGKQNQKRLVGQEWRVQQASENVGMMLHTAKQLLSCTARCLPV